MEKREIEEDEEEARTHVERQKGQVVEGRGTKRFRT